MKSKDESMGNVVAIGGFGSLHHGHRKLIETAKKIAGEMNATLCIYTFDDALIRHKGSKALMSMAKRMELFEEMGAEKIIVQKFDDTFKNLSPEEFVREILVKKLSCVCAVTGENFRFGKNAMGNSDTLKELCEKNSIKCEILPLEKTAEGDVISTSLLCKLAEQGRVKEIYELCGNFFTFSGVVVHGRAEGRKIGFPTINMELGKEVVLPGCGVYASMVELDGKTYPGITNIGNAPTYGETRELAETHIIGVNRDMYGRFTEIKLVEKIRDIKRFSSPEELIAQLEKDSKKATQICKQYIK